MSLARGSIALAVLLGACAAPPVPPPAAAPATPAPPGVPVLRNPGFEEPATADTRCVAGWQCSAHASLDSHTFKRVAGGASGGGSLCIERVGHEPWALATQGFHTTAMRGQKLRLSMAVRA